MRPFQQADPSTQQLLVDRRMGAAPRHEHQPRPATTRPRRRRALRVAVATALAAALPQR